MRKVMVIQNVECEPLGRFAGASADFRYLRPYAGESLPGSLDGWDAMIVLGGPIAVYEADENPFLDAEIDLLRMAIGQDFPTLGICLGSQLIAHAAGAKVYAGQVREVGWGTVELTETLASDSLFSGLPASLPVFQLHGDTFDLPEDAERLAGNQAYPNQAFRIGQRVYGLQFHVEVTRDLVKNWTAIYEDYITEAGVLVSAILDKLDSRDEALRPVAFQVISRFLDL